MKISDKIANEMLILDIYSDILVKNRDFFHTPLHSTPPLGSPRRNNTVMFCTEN